MTYLAAARVSRGACRARRGRRRDTPRVTPVSRRSPSPEPIYSTDGKRLNTREYRTRRKLEEERHRLVQRMQQINPEFKPPPDYKYVPGRVPRRRTDAARPWP